MKIEVGQIWKNKKNVIVIKEDVCTMFWVEIVDGDNSGYVMNAENGHVLFDEEHILEEYQFEGWEDV